MLLLQYRQVFAKNTFKGLEIENVIDTSIALSRELRERHGCDAVVALTHQSIQRDRDLVRASPTYFFSLI